VTPETVARLNSFEIIVKGKGQNFCLFVRSGCLAMVPWDEETGIFSGIGSSGLFVDQGLGYLVSRDGQHFLVGNEFEVPAEPAQVEKVLQFSADLKTALRLADS
jgi:hypothetical protein